MKFIKITIAILLAAFALTSCTDDKNGYINEEQLQTFLVRTDYGVYSGGTASFTLNKNDHQLYYNSSNYTFRLQSDDLTKYVQLRMASMPDLNGKANGTLTAQGVSGVGTGTGTYETVKVDGEKRWLWNDNDAVGVIILCIQ